MFLLPFLAATAAAIPPVITAPPPTPPAAPTDWAAVARADVEAGYALMRDNHPGWVDPDNRAFRGQLEQARAAGQQAAEVAVDARGHAEALAAFSTVLADGHAVLRAKQADDRKVRWPGFLAAWRGDRLLVAQGDAAPGFGPGSTITACDGVPIAELIVRRLQPRSARLNEAGHWWSEGGKVLTDGPGTAGPAPTTCTMTFEGRTADIPLRWQDIPDDWMVRSLNASNGGYTDIGLVEPRPGLFVVGMPTFANGAEAAKLYKALTDEIGKRHGALSKARAIVFDLRFNQGGSSAWSRQVASALWGESAVKSRLDAYFHPVEIWWRNSPGNIAYLKSLVGELENAGQPATAAELGKLADRMDAELAAGRPMTVEEAASTVPPPPAAAPTLDRPVYVIVPGQCASACLDALDLFKLFPGVRLIGAPSAADSQYMEVRKQALPSSNGDAVIPLKIWTHRPRKGGEVYWPDISMKQLDWSTDAFLDAIESDLSKRAAAR